MIRGTTAAPRRPSYSDANRLLHGRLDQSHQLQSRKPHCTIGKSDCPRAHGRRVRASSSLVLARSFLYCYDLAAARNDAAGKERRDRARYLVDSRHAARPRAGPSLDAVALIEVAPGAPWSGERSSHRNSPSMNGMRQNRRPSKQLADWWQSPKNRNVRPDADFALSGWSAGRCRRRGRDGEMQWPTRLANRLSSFSTKPRTVS